MEKRRDEQTRQGRRIYFGGPCPRNQFCRSDPLHRGSDLASAVRQQAFLSALRRLVDESTCELRRVMIDARDQILAVLEQRGLADAISQQPATTDVAAQIYASIPRLRIRSACQSSYGLARRCPRPAAGAFRPRQRWTTTAVTRIKPGCHIAVSRNEQSPYRPAARAPSSPLPDRDRA